MPRPNRTSRKNARKAERDARKKARKEEDGPCDCHTCLFDRKKLDEGLYFIRGVYSLVTDDRHCIPMFDLMYQTFRAEEYFDMADGDVVVQIDDSDPTNAAIKNLKIKRKMVCYADGCDNIKHLRRCTGCRRVRYCSEECQKKDWKNHKPCCVPRNKPDPL
ncbi:histone-lysine N-methyltransferase / SET domain containing protein [Paramecium bursaria Chlorella virus NE-JV-1]|nr:histone-lysine N-methyltransferase / SET domain containing protein [Paramecium bursaria Chlorella virus NE-JV-1]